MNIIMFKSESESVMEINSVSMDVTYVTREKVPPSIILVNKACSFLFPCIVLIFIYKCAFRKIKCRDIQQTL